MIAQKISKGKDAIASCGNLFLTTVIARKSFPT